MSYGKTSSLFLEQLAFMPTARRIAPFFFILLSLASIFATAWAQNTLYLSPSGSDAAGNQCHVRDQPCATLRHAVAQSRDGDTILLLNGQHFEPVDSSLGAIVIGHSLNFMSESDDPSAVTISQRLDMDSFCRDTSNANRIDAIGSGETYFQKCSIFVLDDSVKPTNASLAPKVSFRGMTFRSIFLGLWNDLHVNSTALAAPSASASIENVITEDLVFGFVLLRKWLDALTAGVRSRVFTVSNLVVKNSYLRPAFHYAYHSIQPYSNCIAVASNWDMGTLDNVRFENVTTGCDDPDPRIFSNMLYLGECELCTVTNLVVERCTSRDLVQLRTMNAMYRASVLHVFKFTNLTFKDNHMRSALGSFQTQSDFTFEGLVLEGNVGYGTETDTFGAIMIVATQSLIINNVRAVNNQKDTIFSVDTGQNFMLTNVYIDAGHLTTLGCVRTNRLEQIRIFDSVFKNCYSKYPGGFFQSDGDLSMVLSNLQIDSAISEGSGGGIAVTSFYTLVLHSLTITNCVSGQDGGAIFASAMNSPGYHFVGFAGNSIISGCRAKGKGAAMSLSSLMIAHEAHNRNYQLLVTNNTCDAGTFALDRIKFYEEFPTIIPNITISGNRARAAACLWIENPETFALNDWQKIATCKDNVAELYANEVASAPVRVKLLKTSMGKLSNGTYFTINGDPFKVTVALEDYYMNIVQQYPAIVNVKLTYIGMDGKEVLDMRQTTTVAVDDNNARPELSLTFSRATIGGMAKISFTPLGHILGLDVPVKIEPCPTGTRVEFSADGSQLCWTCLPGKFTSEPNSTTCYECPKGYYAPKIGTATCTPCPVWTLSGLQSTGQSSEQQCTAGTTTLIIVLIVISVAIVIFAMLVPVSIYFYIKKRQKDKLVDSLLNSDYLSLVSIQMQEQIHQGGDITQSLMSRLPPHLRIDKDAIRIGQMLGNGSQAALFSGVFQGSAIALKLYQKRTVGFEPSSMEEFIREVDIQARFGNHPNLLRLMGVCDFDANKIGIVVELMKGSIASMILMNNVLYKRADKLLTIPWKKKKHILQQIAAGMAHLHSNGVVHRDLKLENVLTDEDAAQIKICDFGFSRVLNDKRNGNSSNLTMNIGTASYICPELIGGGSGSGSSSGLSDSIAGIGSYQAYQDDDKQKLLSKSSGSLSAGGNKSTGGDKKASMDFEQTSKVDVYSFGILMAALFMETTKPYGEMADIDVIWGVKARALRPEVDEQLVFASVKILCEQDGLSQQQTNDAILEVNQALELMRRCWADNPRDRPSFKEMLKSSALS